MNSYLQILSENTIEDSIEIDGYTFYLQRVLNCDSLLDTISEEEFKIDERVPYWAELWPSSLALSEYIIQHVHLFKKKSVLELGCGLGLSGIVASFVGAEVLFTDYDEHALKYTENNFFRNFGKKARVQLMDWREPMPDKRFDIIIAADVLYEKRWLEPVWLSIEKLLKNDGVAIIAEPGRTIANGFYSMVNDSGYDIEKIPWKMMFENKERHVNIYRIT